jgi:N-acetylglucosamine-6-sulfatase
VQEFLRGAKDGDSQGNTIRAIGRNVEGGNRRRSARTRGSIVLYSVFIVAFVLSVCALIAGYFLTSPHLRAQTTLVKPNIVFVLTDDQHMYHVKHMPYLSSRPHGNWVEFTNAFENVPLCCPTRATNLTGQYSHHHGILGNSGRNFNDTATIATWLKSAGYRTALIGKYLNGYPYPNKPTNYIPPGWDYWAAFQDVGYYNYRLNEHGTSVTYGSTSQEYSTDVLHRKALNFLDTTPTDKPFFLYLNPHAPHAENIPAPRHKGAYGTLPVFYGPNFNESDVSDKPAWVRGLPLESKATMDKKQRLAAETLLAVDESIKGIADKLIKRGQLNNTVFIFMTDNGFSFGAHRWLKKTCVYEECVRTPLLIRYPGTGENRTETRLVSSVDIAPTLASLAQVTPTLKGDGRSLVPLLNGTATNWRSSLLLEYQGPTDPGEPPTFWAVRTKEWKYVELETGEKELYDMVKDPYELVNVVNRSDLSSIRSSLSAELQRLKTE